jgi:hypothetical protein
VRTDAEELAARLDRIANLAEELAKCEREAVEQRAMAERIMREIEILKRALKPVD